MRRLYLNAWYRASARRARPSSGAAVRRESRSSRRNRSARTSSSSAGSPRARSSAVRRAARTSGVATTKNFTSAPGAMTVPISRPSSTAPGRLRRELALIVHQRLADLRNRRHDRGGFGDCWRFQRAFVELGRIERDRGSDRLLDIVGRVAGIEHRLGHRAIDQAGIEMRAAHKLPPPAWRWCPCPKRPDRR